MAPTLQKAYDQGVVPLINEEIDEVMAFERAVEPFREFMLKHVREDDLILFTELSELGPFENERAIPLRVLIPLL